MSNEKDKKFEEISSIVGDYKYGFKTEVENVFDTGYGISEEVVRKISAMKNEPEWMLNIRLKAYKEFAKMKWPTFGPDLSKLNFDEYKYFIKSSENTESKWENVPGLPLLGSPGKGRRAACLRQWQ